ncbi:MAG: hypothetical protein OSB57_09840 [Planctomycetota bacterium]|nr:hypothetical protein [Planctomycetota bacterium]
MLVAPAPLMASSQVLPFGGVRVALVARQEQVPVDSDPVGTTVEAALRLSEVGRQRTGEVHALLEGLEGQAMRDKADLAFANTPDSTARVMLLRAGRSTPPGLAGARYDRRGDRRLEARTWVQQAFDQEPELWLGLLHEVLESEGNGTDKEVLSATLRVVGELGWFEFGPAMAKSLGAQDARTIEAARRGLFNLFGRWFETNADFLEAWPALDGRDTACLSVAELAALEARVDELTLGMLELKLAVPGGSPLAAPGNDDSPEAQAMAKAQVEAQAAEAQRRLALVRELFAQGHPGVRAQVAGMVREAVGRRALGADGAIDLLIERVTHETDPAAFHAVLVALLELVEGMSAEAEKIDHLRAALLDPAVTARLELGDTVVTALSRLPWTATGPNDFAAGIGPSAQLLARLSASDRPVDYDRLHIALAAHASLCQNALQVRAGESQAPVFSLWQVRGLHRATEDPASDGALDPGIALTALVSDATLPLEVRLDLVAASPYFLEVLPLLGALESEHERSQSTRLELALLDALEVTLVHGRFPGEPFLTPFGVYLDQVMGGTSSDLRQRLVALLGNADLDAVLEEVGEGASASPRRLRRVLLASVESRLLLGLAGAEPAMQLRYLELLPLLPAASRWVEGLSASPVFDVLLDSNQGRPIATLAALIHHLGPASVDPAWVSLAEATLLRMTTVPVGDEPSLPGNSEEPVRALLPDHRLRLVVGWISSWPSDSLAAMTAATRLQSVDWFLTALLQPDEGMADARSRSTALQFLWEQAMAAGNSELTERVAAVFAPLPPLAAEESYPIAVEEIWRPFGGLIDNLNDHTLWLTRRDGLQDLLAPEPPPVATQDPVTGPVVGEGEGEGEEGDGETEEAEEDSEEATGDDGETESASDGDGEATDGGSSTDDGGHSPVLTVRS